MDKLFQSIQKQLEDNRRELLDLSTRNRLISLPLESKVARIVQIFDEKSEEVFRRLIVEKKDFTFLPGKSSNLFSQASENEEQEKEELTDLPLPDEDDFDTTSGKAKRHTDSKLQTRLTAEKLQRRLFDLYNENRTIIEEQGVNVMYLALGMIKWIDKANNNSVRYAPLVLIPVDLIRKSAAESFAVKWREEDLQENLSLAEKFKIEFGITLPSLSIDEAETFNISEYFDSVVEVITPLDGWAVEYDTMCIGFFSFAKFLMYRDLDDKAWPEGKKISQNPLIRKLLLTRQGEEDTLHDVTLDEKENLDEKIPVHRLDHIVDADSSQTVAIELVREGRDLVIQGPPGTGKSQTITNIIASSVLDGKKVLFLSEKLAALEVVKRRLEKEGLGVVCLELHSNKAKKSDVASDLKKTWELGRPKAPVTEELNDLLNKSRNELNIYPKALHKKVLNTGKSAFDHIGVLAHLGQPKDWQSQIKFQGAEEWDAKKVAEYRHSLEELQRACKSCGDIESHVWRGVNLTQYFGTERQAIVSCVEKLTGIVNALSVTKEKVTSLLSSDKSYDSEKQLKHLLILLSLIAERPEGELPPFSFDNWKVFGSSIIRLAENKSTFESIATALSDTVNANVWRGDISGVRKSYLVHGKKFYRVLISEYRNAVKLLKADLKDAKLKDYDSTVTLLNKIQDAQQSLAYIKEKESLGKSVFGIFWDVENKGSWLLQTAKWHNALFDAGFTESEIRAAREADIKVAADLSRNISTLLNDFSNETSFIADALQINWHVYMQDTETDRLPLAFWKQWVDNALRNVDLLPDWINMRKQVQMCVTSPVKPLAEELLKGSLEPHELLNAFDRIFAYQNIQHIMNAEDIIASFNGDSHNNKVIKFREHDLSRLQLSKLKVLDKHYEMIPDRRPVGMVGTVLGEVNKQRSHKPVRKLLKEAGAVVQNIKPVFMMSPLSVAQYLEPGSIEFDLLVIDEASQVQPVDALGAVARSKQIVVVGDDKQLPPTMFFSKLTSNSEGSNDEDDAEEVGQVQAKEMESILSLCKARGIHDTMLKWHYRSRHESLITISNIRYYQNKLYIIPSPWKLNSGMGLVWKQVKGVYDRGSSKTNIIEAKAVAQAVLNHAKTTPNLTLGVAAFSMSQQRAIQDEIEIVRRKFPVEMESFMNMHPHEPFFIKNLENVQGDERDVIFLSVGYGKDAEGRMFQNFGPLNKIGGERRLNVLISRARMRCEVYSSITDQDITIADNTREGVKGLKQFMQFARTGIFDVAEASDKEIGSPFEEAVKNALELHYPELEVQTQVGVAGFFIDLAICDPNKKGRYVLGIECDGVAYHSSPSARERDRMRQSVLESKGWVIHRLWGIDFFKKPELEISKIIKAYNDALLQLEELDELEDKVPERNIFHMVRETEQEEEFAIPYQSITTVILPDTDPYKVHPSRLASLIEEVLSIEAPIHTDELVTRMRELWGWSRAADKFKSHIADGLKVLQKSKTIVIEDNFIYLQSAQVNEVRKRSETSPSGTRKPAYLPPAEIDLALTKITAAAISLTRDEAAKEVSKVFGFKSMSSELKNVIDSRTDTLINTGVLKFSDGRITV